MFRKLLEYGNCMRFAKFISKRFVMSIVRQLAKVKAKVHAECNQQPLNIIEGSAKDKGIKLESDEQSRNSKLVFPKFSKLDFNFYLFFRESFFTSSQEVQPMNKLSLRWYSTKYNKF